MAILNMKRIEILAMLTDSKAIVDYVQRQGTVQIDEYKEEENHFYKLSTSSSISQFDKFQDVAESAVTILNKYASAKGGGLLASFAPRPELTVSEFAESAKNVDATLEKCYKINSLYKAIQDCGVEIAKDQTSIDQLLPWKDLDIAPSTSGTATSAVFIGSIPEQLDRETLLTKIAELNPEINADADIVSSDKNQTCLVAICHKDNAGELEQALRSIGFIALPDNGRKKPADRINDLAERIADKNAVIAKKEEEIKAFNDSRNEIAFLRDYFELRTDKYRALDKISMDENIFILTGYIADKNVEKLKKYLELKFDVAISVTDTDPEDETIPVQLENNGMGRTMESITKMYSTPSRRDLDPNFVMTIFYYCLFGLMLGDAGYGLIMTILCLIVKFKVKPERKKMDLVNYGLYCGIGTTVWGALQNSWFGDLPKWIANGLKSNDPTDFISTHHLYWFDPLNNIPRFLLLCFLIGILHLCFALGLNVYKNIKQKNAFEGIIDNVPLILFLIGLIPVINDYIGGTALAEIPATKPIDDFIKGNSSVFYGILIAGVALIILGPMLKAIKNKQPIGKIILALPGGLYGLYNAASGYLGDILSYARLLALGLCTGVIASVINQLAATPLGGNVVLFIIIEVIGHVVNLAINLIGAYVHANRLQYVEFFSKFYEGGGEPFEPLTVNTKTFRFKEEV